MYGSRKYSYPTMEEISLSTTPPFPLPWIFHIFEELVTPTPLEISTK